MNAGQLELAKSYITWMRRKITLSLDGYYPGWENAARGSAWDDELYEYEKSPMVMVSLHPRNAQSVSIMGASILFKLIFFHPFSRRVARRNVSKHEKRAHFLPCIPPKAQPPFQGNDLLALMLNCLLSCRSSSVGGGLRTSRPTIFGRDKARPSRCGDRRVAPPMTVSLSC